MTEYKAKLSYMRLAPRKTRLVANLIRGLSATNAKYQLQFSPKRASKDMLKLLESAISNAKNINKDIDEKDLYVKTITVDEGPMLRRFRPVARGAVHEIQKKTSHVTIVLAEKKSEKEKASSTKRKQASSETKNKPKTTKKEKVKQSK